MRTSLAPTPARARAAPPSRAESAGVPAHVLALVFASVSVILGVYWDVSWHRSIGRDTFWSPPHMAIYVGGVLAGVACAYVVLRTTFAGTEAERGRSVRFWRFFQGPLGAWVAIWGTFAMLTSAPFDDWWHNAYGLDVKILSPPHTLLALGIWAIQFGALLLVLGYQNREADPRRARVYGVLYAVTAGLVLLNVAILSWEQSYREMMHAPHAYQVICAVFPLFLVGTARASRLRWPFASAAAVYTAAVLLMVWTFPLFPATPRLGPIRHVIDRMTAPDFPVLILVPALAMDVVARRWPAGRSRWALAAVLGAVFFAVLLAVQWPFASLLMSDAGQNRFFGTPFTAGFQDVREPRFWPVEGGAPALVRGLVWALAWSVLSTALGMAWGDRMRRVQR